MKNKGLAQYRYKQNPLEKKFAEAWEKQNTNAYHKLDGRDTIDYLLAKNPNIPSGEVSERDRTVAATVIQWLGSPVGQSFVTEVMENHSKELKNDRKHRK